MNIINYIKKYGCFSFNEEPYNEVDNIILASLSYLDFSLILFRNTKKTLKDAANILFNTYSRRELNNNIPAVKTAYRILKSIYKTKRFENLELYNYMCKRNEYMQFSALCIKIDRRTVYISFEGTDDLVIGWREDAEMSYRYPVPAQKEAIKYINSRIHPFSKKKYLIGGHSKGANLALVAAMHANHFIRPKILAIYLNDGPGLREQQIKSREYRRIKNRIKRIIPNYSIVGLMLINTVSPQVILSSKSNVFAHNIINWEITDNHFTPSKLSDFSVKLNKEFKKWLDNYSDEEREEFIKDLFDILNRAEINSILELKKGTLLKIIKVLKETKRTNHQTKQMSNELIKILLMIFKEENRISKKIQAIKH